MASSAEESELRGLDAQDGDGRRLAPAALELVVHVVDEEPAEPLVEAVGIAQAGQVAPAGDERLLDGVLGTIGVAQDEARHGEEPVDDARHDHVERLPVALGCSLHERSLHRDPFLRRGRCGRAHTLLSPVEGGKVQPDA